MSYLPHLFAVLVGAGLTIQVGMKVTITGVRAVSGAPMMRGVRIELEDGTVHRVSSRA